MLAGFLVGEVSLELELLPRSNALLGAGERTHTERFAMSTTDTHARTPGAAVRFLLPDPPEREPDEMMASFRHLARSGNAYLLVERLGDPETTLVGLDAR